MKQKSRYLVINPDQEVVATNESKSKTADQAEQYTDGFYSSSTDNDNDELRMI